MGGLCLQAQCDTRPSHRVQAPNAHLFNEALNVPSNISSCLLQPLSVKS